MRTFVTLFDMKYAAKGLALYRSLERHTSEPFRLYVFAMDAQTFARMSDLSQTMLRMRVVPPEAFIKKGLADLRPQRPGGNFFFTCTPFVIEWALIHNAPEAVTYLDADTYFFNDPKIAFDEMGDREVAVVPHRFPPHDYARLIPNGRFNVSWVTFTRRPESLTILNWWRDQCFAKCDQESVGDQKYLDAWPGALGDKLHQFQSEGIGAGPWNGYTYEVGEGPTVNGKPLVFYHFHEFDRRHLNYYTLTGYPVSERQRDLIYWPYIDEIERSHKLLGE